MVPCVYLASSVCRSLQCLISALTQGSESDLLFRLTCSVLLWEGRNTANNITGTCGECLQCLGHTGFAPAHGMCAFPVYTGQAPGCSAGSGPWVACTAQAPDCFAAELSKVGPGLGALPSPKPLRFRFSGTPQRHRDGWACFLCPSKVQAGQATSCLVSTLPIWRCILSPP